MLTFGSLFAGIGALTSALSAREWSVNFRWRLMNTAGRFCENIGPTSPSTETFEPLPISSESMCYAVDSPVRTSLTPASELVSTGNAPDSGPNSQGSLAWFDPESSSWKTWQFCLTGEWAEFSETFPRSGTMQNGMLFPRQPLVPRTAESGSGLWPTPHGMSNEGYDGHGNELSMVVRVREGMSDSDRSRKKANWPTPQAHDAHGGRGKNNIFSDGHYYPHDLADAVKEWQTPTARDRHSLAKVKGGGNASPGGTPLAVAVMARETFPTPSSRDWKDTPGMSQTGINPDGTTRDRVDQLARAIYAKEKSAGQLNPTFVEWLMGYPQNWTLLESSGRKNGKASRV